jgi:tryptophan synthase alpha chain
MNRIKELFQRKQRDILSVYFTAGYPELNATAGILKALQDSGQIDMAEIGIPFSDPMADGAVIQAASTRALANGVSLRILFEQLKDVRKEVHIPLILMGYLNPIMQFGFEEFCRKCAETGVDGAIIPDLPFADYIKDYKPVADRYDLKVVMLITPETSAERIRLIDQHTDGFIYMVSSAAITGAQQSFDSARQEYFRRISSMNLRNPCLVGFGVSNKATYEAATSSAAGAIIGSKFIQLISSEKTISQAIEKLLREIR